MFVVTRKANETVMIGDDIQVSVLAVIGQNVRLVVECPREIPVVPDEVYRDILADRGQKGR